MLKIIFKKTFSFLILQINEKGFKMFMKNLVKVIMNVSRDNYTRIFLQTLNIVRDYIPKNIIYKNERIYSFNNR